MSMVTEHQQQTSKQVDIIVNQIVQRFRRTMLIVAIILLFVNLGIFVGEFFLKSQNILNILSPVLAFLAIFIAIYSLRTPPNYYRAITTDVSNDTQLEVAIKRSFSIFQFNVPLADPVDLYGRDSERIKLISRVHKKASTSIIGPRRVGKTWLMQYLMLVAPNELGPTYRIGYLDATLPSCKTIPGFTNTVLKELGYSPLIPSDTQSDLSTLEKMIEDLYSQHVTPVLCIDEFEGLEKKQGFNAEFFSGLRALATRGKMVLIVASKIPLTRLVSEEIKTSKFYNIFENIQLRHLNEQQAKDFIQRKSKQAGFTPEEQSLLLDSAMEQEGGKKNWPIARLQMAGQMLLEDNLRAARKASDYNKADQQVYEQQFKRRIEEGYSLVAS